MPNHELSPWYRWYPRDFMASADVQAMTWEERGIYRWLLDVVWMEGSIPADVAKLARLCQMPVKQFAGIWAALNTRFDSNEGDETKLTHRKIETIRLQMIEASEKRSKSGSEGGKAKARKSKETLVEQLAAEAADLLCDESLTSSNARNLLDVCHEVASEVLDVCSSKAVAKSYHADADADITTSYDAYASPDGIAASRRADELGTEDGVHGTVLATNSPFEPGVSRAQDGINPREPGAPPVQASMIDGVPETESPRDKPRPRLPVSLPYEWPSSVNGKKILCKPFLAAFANVSKPEKMRVHGPSYLDVLTAMSNRKGVSVHDAWNAFADCFEAHNGMPLFSAKAKSALSYLKPSVNVTQLSAYRNAPVPRSGPAMVTAESLAALR